MNSEQTEQSQGDILIVDDVPENLHVLFTMLIAQGYEVRRVLNGKQALNAVLTDPPDLILLDIKMPEMDGYEVCSLLKAQPSASAIPVIFLSALDEVLDKVKAFSVGGADYISKPFQFEEVIVRIENQLTIQRQKALLQKEIRKSQLLAEITMKIRQSLELEQILQTTVTEVQKILQTDRAVIYHFLPDWSGKFVVEALAAGCLSLLSRDLKDPCFEERYIELYFQGRVSAITDIFQSNLQDCYIQLLQQLNVRANLVVPIPFQDRLWGLLIAHQCTAPRQWSTFEVELLQQLADQVGVALTQAELLEALRQSEERYRIVVEDQTELICRFLPDRTLTFVNEAFCQYASRPHKALIGEVFTHPIDPTDQERFWQQLVALNQKTPVGILELEVVTSNGETSWYQWTNRAIFNPQGQIVEYQSVGCDVTELKRAKARLLHDALHDGLTGMPNRTLFMDRLEQAIKHSQSHLDCSFAVLFVDLDRFKLVNDSLGHLVGDQLLIATAHRLRSCLRDNDTLARLGGDEFAILLADVRNTDYVEVIATRIRAAVIEPLELNGYQITITASIGIALNHAAYQNANELLRDADIAMYQAKAQGRDLHTVFNPNMHVQALALLQLENELRRAVDQQEFRVYYQPIISLSNQQIIGFEALVRWQHPESGLVYPQEFISVAEETGLIVPIGWWVLREATRQVAQWQSQVAANPPLTISVNLSGQQFSQPDMVAQVAAILQESGLNSRYLRLEITEGVIMVSAESAITALSQLREMGVQLYVDDFGTAYSSLSRLHSFPLDALKIDRSFVTQLEAIEGSVEIVRAIITLAHNLRMYVIAEGVETADQAQRLRILGCEYAQGYFWGRPLPRELTETLLLSLRGKCQN